MKLLPAATSPITLILASAGLLIAALALMWMAAWLSMMRPPATLLDNGLLALGLAAFSLGAFFGGRSLRARVYQSLQLVTTQQPPTQQLHWLAGLILLGVLCCLAALS